MDKKIVEEKVNKMLENKKIDLQFIPFIHIFFQMYNKSYNLTEQQLDYLLKNYKDNVNETFFINMKNKNVRIDARGKRFLLDTDLKNEISIEDVDLLIKRSISEQAIAVLPTADANGNGYIHAFTKYNEVNNLQQNLEPEILILLNMAKAALGIHGKPVHPVGKHKAEYKKQKDEKEGSMEVNLYENKLLECFEKIEENNAVTKDMCKKIYGYCVVVLMVRYDEGIIDISNGKRDVIKVLENIRKLQQIYSIQQNELENINMEENSSWEFPAGDRMRELMQNLKINKIEYNNFQSTEEQEKNDNVLKINKNKLVEIVNRNVKNKEVTEELIKLKVSELMQKNNYIKEIEPFLTQFFLRSAIVYKWDEQEFIKKVDNFGRKVKNIEIIRNDEDAIKVGEFSLFYKRIGISKGIILGMLLKIVPYESILKTFFHEMRHATDYTERDYIYYEKGMHINTNGIEKIKEDKEGDYINEKYVEGGATLISGGNYRDKLKTSLVFDGYDVLAFPLGMMSASLGMSETELLRLGEKGREKFEDTISVNHPSISDDLRELKDLYRLIELSSRTFKYVLKQQKTEAIARVYLINKKIYDERMEKNPPQNEKEIIKAQYEQYKMYKNLYNTCKWCGNDSKILKELTGMSFEEIKKKTKISKSQKKDYLDVVQEFEEFKFNNKELKRPIKMLAKAMYKQEKEKNRKKESLPSGNIANNSTKERKKRFFEQNKVDNVGGNVTIHMDEVNNKTKEEHEEH